MSHLSIYSDFTDCNSNIKKKKILAQITLGYLLQSSQITEEPEGQKRA